MHNPFSGFNIPGFRATWLSETTSTNDAARGAEYSHGDIIIAKTQSEGRGQRGNRWDSEPGDNLTFSLVIESRFLPATEQFYLSEAVALAIADTLAHYGIDACVKWPNDIYIINKKIAGILIENDIMGANLSRSVIGIGLNVNQNKFPDSLPNPVSMKLAVNRSFDNVEILETFCRAFSHRYSMLENGKFEDMESDYLSRLYLLNEAHTFSLPAGERFVGTIRNVKPTGELIVEHPDGETRGYLFREIIF